MTASSRIGYGLEVVVRIFGIGVGLAYWILFFVSLFLERGQAVQALKVFFGVHSYLSYILINS